MQVIDDLFCATLWGNASHCYSYCPYVGASGRLLILWDSSAVEVWSLVSREHILIIHG
jgi:hypothetical protein